MTPPRILHVPPSSAGSELLRALSIEAGPPVIAMMGGAAGLSDAQASQLRDLIQLGVARAAQALAATVVDGGTQSGVMGMLDEGLGTAGHAGYYIGVAPAGRVGHAGEEGWSLGPHHTHQVLVQGEDFGDETETMYALIGALARGAPSVGVLANGGGITRRELALNVEQGREVIVLRGSGRLADELASLLERPVSGSDPALAKLAQTGRLTLFDLSDPPQDLADLIEARLQSP